MAKPSRPAPLASETGATPTASMAPDMKLASRRRNDDRPLAFAMMLCVLLGRTLGLTAA